MAENSNNKKEEKKGIDKQWMFIGGVVVGVVALGLLLFFMLFQTPSAEDVCKQVEDLSEQNVEDLGLDLEFGYEDLTGMTVDQCVDDEEEEAKDRGWWDTRKLRNCIMDAKNLEEALDCADEVD